MIKKYLFCLILATCFKAFPGIVDGQILIELGDRHFIKSHAQRIWIQNAKTAFVLNEKNQIAIRGDTLGETLIKFDNQTLKIVVLPIGFKRSAAEWKKQSHHFVSLSLGYCSISICLRGKLFSLAEYKKIVDLMERKSIPIYLSMEMSDQVKIDISKWIQTYFRENNMTPLNVSFGKPWRVYSSTKDEIFQKREVLQKIGVQWIESQQKIDLVDNIKVEIKIIEIKRELSRSLGIRWPSEYSATVAKDSVGGIADFDLKLQAYEKTGEMKILASPNILCRSGKSAEFFAGGEFPIKVMNYKTNDVVWKKFGIELKIKPLVDSTGQMSIELETMISSVDKSRSVDQIPALHTHKVSSHFDLARSKTIVLSGLIKNESGSSVDGLPFLSQLPILGRLFSSKDFLENRTELLILVKPTLMED